MSLQAAGGLHNEHMFKITETTPDLLAPTFVHKNNLVSANNTCCYIKYVMVNDEIPTKTSLKNRNYDLIVPLFHKYRYYDGSIPLRILGRVILFCHELQEKVLIKKYKKTHNCQHPSNFCICANEAIKHIIRPYKKFCIF